MQARWIGFVCVVGCGPVVAPQGGDESSEGSTSASSPSTSVGASSVGEVETTPSDESVGETVAEETSGTTDAPEVVLCGASDPLQPLAILSGDGPPAVLRADTTTVPLALPPASAPADAASYPVFAARDEWVAAVRSWSLFDDGEVHYGADLELYDASGALLWMRTEVDASLATPYLGHDGTITTTRSHEGGASEGVVYRGGVDDAVLPDFFPTGPMRADAWIPGTDVEDGIGYAGWMSSGGAAQRIRYPALASAVQRDNGDYVYVAEGERAPMFVLDTPVSASTVPLPALAAVDPSLLSLWRSPGASWLLLHDDGERWWRLEVDTAALEELVLVPPDGATLFECYRPTAAIDDTGRVLLGTRDASSAAVLRWDPGTSEWTTLGERVTLVEDIAVQSYGETALVTTMGQGMTFCPPQDFEPGTAPLAGSSAQLVRPADGVAQVLAPETIAYPNRAGTCAAIVGAQGLRMLDLVAGVEVDPLPDDRAATWWR